MTGAIRIWAAAFIAALAITRADAADLTPPPEPLPPPPPIFFVHVGALGAFYQPPERAVDRRWVLEGNTEPPRYRHIK